MSELDLPVVSDGIGVAGLESEYGIELCRCEPQPSVESDDARLELPVGQVLADGHAICRPSGGGGVPELLCHVRPECRRADRLEPGLYGRTRNARLARASGRAARRSLEGFTRQAAGAATAGGSRTPRIHLYQQRSRWNAGGSELDIDAAALAACPAISPCAAVSAR